MTQPIFDIDDLSYFFHFSLGLRHSYLKSGLQEQKEGCPEPGGDAVSLAHHLIAQSHRLPGEATAICHEFQEKVEKFIDEVYSSFHSPNTHYKQATWLFIARGDDARHPYDFARYPLGKCGKASFTPAQVHLLVSTENYKNEDIKYALLNTVLDIKAQIKRLKIEKVRELIRSSSDKKRNSLLARLIEHYENDSWIQEPIFSKLKDLALSAIEDKLNDIDKNIKKGDSLVSVKIEPFNLEGLDLPSLKKKLFQSIEEQNQQRVEACLAKLPQKAFKLNEENPLTKAAAYQSLAILKAIDEFDASIYDCARQSDGISPPIFAAAQECSVDNLKFLLKKHGKLNDKDQLGRGASSNTKSILCGITSLEVIQLLLDHGADINASTEFAGNAFAIAVANAKNTDNDKKVFDVLLARSNFLSKYLSLLAVTEELFYSTRYLQSDKNAGIQARHQMLQQRREIILLSLTERECARIKDYYQENKNKFNIQAEKTLIPDLMNLVTKQKDKISTNILRCFYPEIQKALSTNAPQLTSSSPTTVRQNKIKLREIKHYYAYANSDRYHLFRVKLDSNKAQGDKAKTLLLNQFKNEVEKCTTKTELQGKIEQYKKQHEYKTLATAQGLTSWFFNLETDSVKAFKTMCEDANKQLSVTM